MKESLRDNQQVAAGKYDWHLQSLVMFTSQQLTASLSKYWTKNKTTTLFLSLSLALKPASPPYSSSEPQKIYAKILDGVIKYPPFLSEAAKSIINKLSR